ncbi:MULTISPECIES: DUF2264 domain-containing protein [unclassified Paenibacillus]|uniref:DUF2264 domain-containing protein n=1 Tax=Paenibacillus provencensis TaxID=441151 RepID=A0ABW3PQY1_9BACL|nr:MULTISPECIES: DUF2264 domain-containing protein [unclassified Paenibacillus]MCM3127102.1 DUF2264 domain-containing protein [Paenibacillus sp. MER 78]SFS55966.1 hypothetical protein SAMN04488601_1011704 [Paenibacillus sp. 453mf]
MSVDRKYWVDTLVRIVRPVLYSLSERRLKMDMPVEARVGDRSDYTYLEALGRTLAGIAPWLEHGPRTGEEGEIRAQMAELARRAMDMATDPASPDYMNFTIGGQPVVDAAFLANAVLRAPSVLYAQLDEKVKRNLISALRATRIIRPVFSNWLLFSAMIETALFRMGVEDWDRMRVDYALRQHEQWYKGDGAYGDGPAFHWDYYNSYVIQPMQVEILDAVGDQYGDWAELRAKVFTRAERYAAVLERFISPEGTFPPIGRSLAYRFGAFQHLSLMALREELPEELEPAQVRCALTAVIKRQVQMPGTFDDSGWLRIGFAGSQPDIGEAYISTGSLYLCTTVFLPLGLSPDTAFWQGQAEWTALKAWSGGTVHLDKAILR